MISAKLQFWLNWNTRNLESFCQHLPKFFGTFNSVWKQKTSQYIFSNSHKISTPHINVRSKNLQNATYRNIEGYGKIKDDHWVFQLHVWSPNLPTCFLCFPNNISLLFYFYNKSSNSTVWYSKALLKSHISYS